tara:strand:- start:312 stop:650 length:339 start_codon:yes stop_codon:yes gene_type:complete
MKYKDVNSKAQALLELNNVFNLLSLIREDNVLIVLSNDGDEGEFTVRVMDATQDEEESTVTVIAQGIISMLEENPDVIYLQGVEVSSNDYSNYGENVVPFSVKKKIKDTDHD